MSTNSQSTLRASLATAVIAQAMVAILPVSRAIAQAPVGMLSLSVRHNTLKNTTKPTGELKAQIDSLDVLLAGAAKVGRTSEQRRLYAHANALLGKRSWTAESEYAASLSLRTDRQVVDPSRPWAARLEQIFAPSIALDRTLTARATLRQRAPGSAPNAPLTVIKEVGEFVGVPRDLRDVPFVVDANMNGVTDGAYVFSVEVLDSARTLGTTSLNIVVRNGLDASIARLEAAAASVAEPVRSDLLFPVDRLRQVNLSRIALGTFNPVRDFSAAESLLVAVKAKKDPWAGRTGDIRRHYLLAAAGEIMPYRMYIPKAYSPTRKMPLVVALHGLGGTENDFFDAYGRAMPALAEKHGYIVVAPLGYRVDGAYGVSLTGSNDPAAKRTAALSEQDVLEVVKAVKAQYAIDDSRVFLMGHSMGAIGTWALAAKYPDPWAGLGLFAGFGVASSAKVISGIPQFVVHGDADPTVSVSGSRLMVSALKGVGANVTYIEVAGGDHGNVVEPNLPGMFALFDTLSKRPAVKTQPER